ncbi:sarcosine oxidase subunit gamma [Bordetella genomosp. 8]|nr:sarcosine oxidase subunit gamma family protein [Bordetella genomosp. 8]
MLSEQRAAWPTPRHESPLTGIGHLLAEHGSPNGEFEVNGRPLVGFCIFRASPDEPALHAGVGSVIGISLPLQPNTYTQGADIRAIWLGPDEWMLASAVWSARDMESRLRHALGPGHYSVVDVTSGYTSVTLSGRKAPLVLARGCPLDLSARAFPMGECAQSVCFKAPVIVCAGGSGIYELIIRRSFAEYLMLMLLDAYKPIQQANLRY